MKILVTGGSGSVGRDVVPALLDGGYEVTVLDRQCGAPAPPHSRFTFLEGSIEDRDAVARALAGADAVVHLAWSFSDDPRALLERDLLAEQTLLELCRANAVKRFVLTSSAVVYGNPRPEPIAEDVVLRPLEGRKPAYGVAKELAENLALLAAQTGGPPATVLRFWWAFGGTVAGRHLREMMRTAASGEPIRVPAGCGGSFVSADDLSRAVVLSLTHPAAVGRIFNVASAFVTWEEVAQLVIEAVRSRSAIERVPPEAWAGAPFLAGTFRLDDRRARELLGYRPRGGASDVRSQLGASIARTWSEVPRPA